MRSLSLFLVGAGTLLGAATLPAQAPAAPNTQPGVGRQTTPGQPGPGDRQRGHGRGGRGMRDGMGARGALRGVTLTDAQRAQLRGVGERYRTERRTLHDQARAQWGRGQNGAPNGGAAARPDSAAREAFRTRARDLQQRQLADVRAVLTADQRATFDRNVAEMRTRAAEYQRDGGRRGGRGQFRGSRG